VPKVGFFFVLIVISFFVFSPLMYVFNDLFFFSAFASIFFGILYALYQFKIKRLLAYSAITHMGYILFSVSQGSVEGFQAFFIYIFIYVVTSLHVFGVLLSFRQHKTFYKLRKVVDFSFLFRSNFTLALLFSLVLLSFAGIPPFAGFFSKFFVFFSLIKFDNYFVLFFLVLCTVVSAVYYIS
jgi:NADH-quinone oxidoreductase subunit N